MPATAPPADSLVAKVQRDRSKERGTDLEFLNRFLASGTSNEVTQQFRWALVTGPAGAGKTRLAIQFLGAAEKQDFRVGFLELRNLKKFDASGWRPHRPTFIVIDYPGQAPDLAAEILEEFVTTACDTKFEYPVRVLLLEREATGEWFKKIAPTDSIGAVARSFCYRENEERWDHPLTPLSSDALLAIMRGRLPDGGTELPDQLLLDTLRRIDPPTNAHNRQSTPRPLFAAATALKIADMMHEGDDTAAIVELSLSKLQRDDVLAWIIDRERTHFWTNGDALDSRTEHERLRIHENLLAVTTIALDIARQKYDEQCPDASREYLPNWRTLDEDRFWRMAGGEPVVTLKRLEPDILGEFFVLDRLNRLKGAERQSLIDAGLTLGGSNSIVVLVRCAIDFPEKWPGLGSLKPSIHGPAIIAFAEAAAGWMNYLGENRFDDIAAALSVVKEQADKHPDPLLDEPLAHLLLTMGVILGKLGRHDDAIATFADLVNRYGTRGQLFLRQHVARALLNMGVRLGGVERRHEGLVAYNDLIRRYGATEDVDLQREVAMALFNKANMLGELGHNDEAIQAYDDVDMRYGTAGDLALREQVAEALFNKAVTHSKLGRHDEELAVYDVIVSRYKTASELALRVHVADALLNKGVTLGMLERNDEAITVYDDVVSRCETASELVLREFGVIALVNKGRRLHALRRNDQAITVYDDVVSRYGTAVDLALREQVSKALFNKGVILYELGHADEAMATYEDVIGRYGTATELVLREWVARALNNNRIILRRLGRRDEARGALNDLVDRFGTAPERVLRRLVEQAFLNHMGLRGPGGLDGPPLTVNAAGHIYYGFPLMPNGDSDAKPDTVPGEARQDSEARPDGTPK